MEINPQPSRNYFIKVQNPVKSLTVLILVLYCNYFIQVLLVRYVLKELNMDIEDDGDIRISNFFSNSLKKASLYIESFGSEADHIIMGFIRIFPLKEVFDAISNKLDEYPSLRLLVIATAWSCGILTLMFFAFVTTSVVVTIAGFLFIAGTLFVVGGLCMIVCIATFVLVMLIVILSLGISCKLFVKLGYVLNGFETTSGILRVIAPSVRSRYLTDVRNSTMNSQQN